MKRFTIYLIACLAFMLDACNLFAPVDPLTPQVSEVTILAVTNTSVKVSASVSDPDAKNSRQEKKSGKIQDYGFVYGILDDPTIENGYVEQGGQTIAASPTNWEDQITRLSSQEKYYIRVYAKNEGGGIIYGPTATFTTGNFVLPILAIVNVSNIQQTSAVINYSISTANSNATITNYGICYSATNQMPTVGDTKVQNAGAPNTGALAAPIDKLSAGTTYYVRAFATTNAGVAYSRTAASFTAGQPAVLKDTTFVMNYSNTYDLETGDLQSRNGMEDLYWYPYGQPAGIYPKNAAKFFVMPTGTDYKALKYSDLLPLNYSTDFIDGSYTTKNNKLFNGTVVAYVTNVGHYGKMRINSKGTDRTDTDVYSGNMEVSITTYNND
ncbi:fibronectin type III domain-containing protein [Dyadobacter luticola]|uniref:Fibronectin type III domain-containing protein n=1 Tax=Dyadobacter luticola TaxID=1979387 RepID=A0A5R9KP85_9BACT|nr:fibronectin type III domain-containing protein [Dyadobacter luticola]TLU98000.1 fibronectin type III domain-containing protein [Dyadobacter luticola]